MTLTESCRPPHEMARSLTREGGSLLKETLNKLRDITKFDAEFIVSVDLGSWVKCISRSLHEVKFGP